MTLRAALTNPAFKRFAALALVYVLTLQALLGAGAQLRVMLAETPGLCTLLGFQEPDRPKHALDACTTHCVGQATTDAAANLALALVLVALAGWTLAVAKGAALSPRMARAYFGRGPPR